MGRSNRRKKADKLDFQKPKLKAGKKKPLATNTTSTSFKSKSIYIHEQLQSQNKNGIVTRTKQNLPELLCHLNHYSSSFRCRALIGIKEIMQQNVSLKLYDPGNVIVKVSKTMMDDDSEVRKACVSILQLLFAEHPETKMSPHFSLVLSHLYCAMSHLSIDVQKDSLKIVELCLKHYPNLIQRHGSTKLLQFFLEMISTKENASKTSNRILVMTFALKKESAVQWRIRVLSQIYALLKISHTDVVNEAVTSDELLSWNCNSVQLNLVSNFQRDRGITMQDLQQSNIVMSLQPNKYDLLDTLFPLLFQCWIEACASGILKKNADTVQTMTLVLSITYMLCKDVYNSCEDKSELLRWLCAKYLPSFNKHFFQCFPFEQPDKVQFQLAKKKEKVAGGNVKASDFVNINLIVCNLRVLLRTEREMDNDGNDATLSYLSEILFTSIESSNSISNHHIDMIISCLEMLFCPDNVSDEFAEALDDLYSYCLSQKCSRSSREKIMLLLMKFYKTMSSSQGRNIFLKLMNDLPSYFRTTLQDFAQQDSDACKLKQENSVTSSLNSTLKCMQFSLQRRNSNFLESLSRSFSLIVQCIDKNCSKLFCPPEINCLLCNNFQNLSVACFLPHLSNLSQTDFVSLAKLCRNSNLSLSSYTFIVDVLMRRALFDAPGFNPLKEDEIFLFLQFLLSVLLGADKKHDKQQDSSTLPDEKFALRRESICDHVCDSLIEISKQNCGLWKVLCDFLQRKIKTFSVDMDQASIMGLMKLSQILMKQNQVQIDCVSIGSFLSSYSLSCYNQSLCWNEYLKSLIVDLLQNHLIMEAFIKAVSNWADRKNSFDALTKLLEIPDLHQACAAHSSEIFTFVARTEKDEEKFPTEIRKLKSIVSIICTT